VAHSQIQNAGQHYASARKHGVAEKELQPLRLTAFGSQKAKSGEEQAAADALAEQIRRANSGGHSYSPW
jgi:hypothetical protein